ncbi:ribosome maturation factor RimM [Echinimonas agarilytica]|uniref:Ribosome maturation factor RimM n=2 Tax=Echinimonas agarilytica TaxID=1215918 RepID=A0AA42B819_9GAMM|nr:ribosome maturation factor RimM [Echinimonas agarilytica]MCM2680482.1 ribosome maturation factor RimM [Echinimonas agarilytica]
MSADTIVVGKIGTPYGIKGWVKIHSSTDSIENIFDYKPWLIQHGGSQLEMTIETWRWHNKGLVAKFDGIDDRNEAERLTNATITVHESVLPKLENEFYWRDLIGCEVITTKGYNLGKVEGLLETGSADVLRVKANPKDAFGQTERLIPYIDGQFVLDINMVDKQITVDWDPGF